MSLSLFDTAALHSLVDRCLTFRSERLEAMPEPSLAPRPRRLPAAEDEAIAAMFTIPGIFLYLLSNSKRAPFKISWVSNSLDQWEARPSEPPRTNGRRAKKTPETRGKAAPATHSRAAFPLLCISSFPSFPFLPMWPNGDRPCVSRWTNQRRPLT